VYVAGIDVDGKLIEKQSKRARDLGWGDIEFQASSILDYQPSGTPDIVLALHACDTATDEALAQAVRWRSRTILAAPCCHHHLQQQLKGPQYPELFRPVLRHNALRERLGDVLTEGFRALILRVLGYRTDVVEFISTEHTAKNLMIRAVKTSSLGHPQAAQEYEALQAYWGVQPHLGKLLEEELVEVGVRTLARTRSGPPL
jgi:hypothetical protein